MRGVSPNMTDVSEMTTSRLAGLLGLSARRVADMRGEGRSPMTPCGTRIDGRELLRRGWAPTRAGHWREVGPADPVAGDIDRLGLVNMAWALRGFAFAAVVVTAEVGPTRELAERLGELAIMLFWEAMNRPGEGSGSLTGLRPTKRPDLA